MSEYLVKVPTDPTANADNIGVGMSFFYHVAQACEDG
jgi:hypothetical protein